MKKIKSTNADTFWNKLELPVKHALLKLYFPSENGHWSITNEIKETIFYNEVILKTQTFNNENRA